ncbi:MAG: ABC transporter permease [Candidatus Aminicenantes bacterium]|nr:ABC transporter permease [Candidatus Aminicenantes bacterium]
MLIHDVRMTFRQFKKYPGYSFLNIFGLAVGMACFFLIFLWVKNELDYDRFFDHAERIYRVTSDVSLRSGQKKFYAYSTPALAEALKKEYPEVMAAARFRPAGRVLLQKDDQSFFESGFIFADSGFLEVFSAPLLQGNREEVLKEPHSLLLSQETAQKYFGDENPVGKTLLVDHEHEYRVTGVLGTLPANTHFRLDFLAYPGEDDLFHPPNWMSLSVFVYVLLDQNVPVLEFEAKIQDLAVKYIGPRGKEIFTYRLQSLTSIHLHSDLEGEFAPVMNVLQVYLFMAVAVLILCVACINFVNLSTARAGKRSREVGVRKVLGAHRLLLGRQFFSESMFSALAAFILSLGLVHLLLPLFNSLSEGRLKMVYGEYFVLCAGIVLLVGILSGSYPAVLLSSFKPSSALREEAHKGKSGLLVRRALIVFQFAVTVFLLFSTGVVYKQMKFMRSRNLGFDQEHIVSVRMRGENVVGDYETVKNELLRHPDILKASAAWSVPGFSIAQRAYVPEGFEDRAMMVLTLYVDHDFVSTLGLSLKEGRDFSRNIASDTLTAYIINEAAQKKFGWQEPIGKKLTCRGRDEDEKTAFGKVIGVVKDFHFRSLHQSIEPVLLRIRPDRFLLMNMKLRGENVSRTMRFIEETFSRLQPEYPFEYWFLDERLDNLYRNEERLAGIFSAFSLIAVFIACLGLFGLAAYLAEQKTKEIGIRKVLGAGTGGLVWLISRDFVKWVGISSLFAWPFAFMAMRKWLQHFSYRTEIGILVAALSGLTAVLIAFFTVSFQAVKAARTNVVRSIRRE